MPQTPLSNESSPYLQQHVDNPVHWYPWGEEALAKAKAENKIILLSIGYSACHWCHVMANESFSEPETAKIMNSLYVNIKVDREERPDIDKIYQTAHFLLNQRPGGWPLTMFLTPEDQLPFFAGTYFPKEASLNQPDFKSLLYKINGYYQQNTANVKKQNHVMRQTLHKISHHSSSRELPSIQIVENAVAQLLNDHDAEHGGFGVAPKFSHTSSIELLLNYGQDRHHQAALQAAISTLSHMAKGGVYDQLEGGFFRYSVDQFWMIPHFEKMLYDNGLLMSSFAKAYKITHNSRFKYLIAQTCEWAINRMQSPEGGFYSTLDADSEGSEGNYYVWERGEVKSLLSEEEYLALATLFGIELDPNFEEKWHLHGYISIDKVAKMINMPTQHTEQLIQSGQQKLLTARQHRSTPARDEKILSSWNGLMIKGMAMSARMLDKNTYQQAALSALDFIKDNCWSDQRLFAVYHQKTTKISGFLDDYAFMLDATIECLKLQWTNDNLRFALELADAILTHFSDKSHGGYFFTANDHETLIQRPKTLSDDATPAGNGVAAHALLTLGLLIGEQRYIDAAEGVIKSAQNLLNDAPTSSCTLVDTLDRVINLPYVIVVRCNSQDQQEWKNSLAAVKERHPVFFIPDHINLDENIINKPVMDKSVAYVCKGQTCFAPISTPEEVLSVDDIAIQPVSY